MRSAWSAVEWYYWHADGYCGVDPHWSGSMDSMDADSCLFGLLMDWTGKSVHCSFGVADSLAVVDIFGS